MMKNFGESMMIIIPMDTIGIKIKTPATKPITIKIILLAEIF